MEGFLGHKRSFLKFEKFPPFNLNSLDRKGVIPYSDRRKSMEANYMQLIQTDSHQ